MTMHVTRTWKIHEGSTHFCGLVTTIPLPNDLFAPWRVNGRTRYSSEVTGWPVSLRCIIPSSQYARCRVCLCWIISRDFSARLLKDVGIMNIYCP